MNAKIVSIIVGTLMCAGLSQTAQAAYTWTTGAVPTRVNIVQGCGPDANKAFAWVVVPGYSQQFSFVTTTSIGAQMLETLTKAVTARKKVELNYYATIGDTPEYLNQYVFRYGKGNCNLEANRFTLIRGLAIVPTIVP
ncbi:exported hypothetical protein [Thiocapsa sp. KS1]|nr:exported hypothetical protein [Thiocapsa sp. KS1]